MARGRARSRNINNCLEEARFLVKQGFQEIVLTGVNIGTFGQNPNGIINLIEEMNRIKELKRIRISSIEPTTISKELFNLMADSEHKLVPFLHIPLQSGTNKLLKLMKRKYCIEEYNDFILEAKENIPNLCLGSDVLIGMPGETEEDFLESYNYIEKSPINYFHTFSYSERKGTYSVKITPKTNTQEIKRRSCILRQLSEKKKQKFYKEYLGENLTVLFESYIDGFNFGYTENYIRVALKSQKNLAKKIINVCLKKNIADIVLASTESH